MHDLAADPKRGSSSFARAKFGINHAEAAAVSAKAEMETMNSNVVQEGRKSWQYFKIKVPAYKWEASEGEHFLEIKPDTVPTGLREGQWSWWCDLASGGHWGSKLRWGGHNPGQLRGATWLELLADFELASGINCMRPQSNTAWGARAELLRGVVKLILRVRGPGAAALGSFFCTSRRITSLAPFGAPFLSGLLRRPVFVDGEATIRVVAVNSWQWAEENKAKRIQLHNISYRSFKRGGFKLKEMQAKLKNAGN